METGYLDIFIFGARQLFPIESANVYIRKDGELLYTVITNEVGQTERLEFETPPTSESTSPGTPFPFTELEVRIEKAGFLPTTIKGVQIFPNVVSRLETELVPRPDSPEFDSKSNDFTTLPQNL